MSHIGEGTTLLGAREWKALRNWYQRSGRHTLPWRQDHRPWAVLVAETLLHRTRAEQVARIYSRVLDEFSGPERVVSNEQRWSEMTRSVGLAWRAAALFRTSHILVDQYGGEIPAGPGTLERLPGVGHYIAGAVRAFGFGMREVLVDTNTIRLAARIGGQPLAPERHRSRQVREQVARLGENGAPPVPADNYALLDLAALVCLPRRPHCEICPVRSGCATGHKQLERHEARE